jgi:peptidase E
LRSWITENDRVYVGLSAGSVVFASQVPQLNW